MKKLLHTIICLAAGIFIGLNFSDDTPITCLKLHDGKYSNSQIEFYDNMIKNVDTMEIYDSSELTEEIINNRDGKIIVEKVIGKVANYKLDGTILNASVNNGTYINYERVEGAKQGDKILTYFIYNPFTNAPDDVLTRLDFIIDDNAI